MCIRDRSKEKHEVTRVDRSGVRLDQSNNELDVMVVEGDGASREVQLLSLIHI